MSQINISLPIDSYLSEIKESLKNGQDLILKASPGSGKTTRVPPALLDLFTGQIIVLEPRRLAARMSAMRVASEMNQEPGYSVGWKMRFESVQSKQTRIIFMTEGTFTALLAREPSLTNVSCVILDEFHERHQQTDVAFALVRKLQLSTRPDLRLIVMSATLDISSLEKALPKALTVNIECPVFPVKVFYESNEESESLVDRTIKGALKLVEDKNHSGHVLVFLPGTAEIVRVRSVLERQLKRNEWLVLELRGSIDKDLQDLAFKKTAERKLILATNIAESSITIPGVTAVLDTGLARIPSFNLFTGMSQLETKAISKASIIQRSGRAGRTSAGVNLRLFSQHDEASRIENNVPEILRMELAQVYLQLLYMMRHQHDCSFNRRVEDLPWIDQPTDRQWLEARSLLESLNIVDTDNSLLRPHLALLPVHPRIARFAEACIELEFKDEAPWLTAILASPDDILLDGKNYEYLGCDLLAKYECLRSRPARFSNVTKAATQIARALKLQKLTPIEDCKPPHEISIAKALLTAYPDRVLKTKNYDAKTNWIDASVCTGGDLRLSKESSASHGEWVVALDASSTRISGSAQVGRSVSTGATITVTMASQITSTDLSATSNRFIGVEDSQEWDAKTGKFKNYRKTKYGTLPISIHQLSDSSPYITCTSSNTESPSSDSFNSFNSFAKILAKFWPKPFESSEFFDSYIIRQNLAFTNKLIDHAWDAQELKEILVAYITDEAKTYDEVLRHSLEDWLRFCVGESEFTELQKIAPTTILVGKGHKIQVHYSETSPPWIEARLQNFFGQAKSPSILRGCVPLTLHLLAPNMRALQVTTDLESFWKGVYPSLRNQYMRKYPRHFWPDDPMQAEPPAMRPRPHKKQ